MAYFEDLAADLDRAQPSGTLSRYVKKFALSMLLPFELADEIAKVPHWENISNVDRANTTYLAKLGKWLTDGIDFDPDAGDCCQRAEQYLIESIRLNQGQSPIDYKSPKPVDRQPAVIFTIGGTAVAYKKSVGADTTYGLRDSKEHNIGAEVLATHDFSDAKFETETGCIITYELKRKQMFDPLRPAVTSFDVAERELFIATVGGAGLEPLEYAALTLNHATVVGDIDTILQAHNNARLA